MNSMKPITILFLSFVVNAQKAKEQNIKSEIKKVKLYITSGEMTHESNLKLEKGRNKLIFSGISAFADPNSIQFTGDNNFRLVSISTEIDFLAAEAYNPRISVLKDSLESMKDALQLNIDTESSFNAELGVLNTNKDLKGANTTLTIDQIKSAGEYYRTRTLEINKVISKLKKEQTILRAKIESTRLQLTDLNYTENQRSNQIIILVDANETSNVNTILKYNVSDCGWVASYDLTAIDINQPVKLKYKAQVYNNTGNEWKDVQLTLSTADPTLSATAPSLNPFYLEYSNYIEQERSTYIQPQSQLQQNYRSQIENEINWENQRAYDNYMLDKEDAGAKLFESNNMAYNFQNVMSNGLSVNLGKKVTTISTQDIYISEMTAEFVVPNNFTCPSDARPYLVEIKEISVPATFSQVSVPKLDQSAFLLATIVGWQDLELVPGTTSVYFGGNFVEIGRAH